MENFKAICPLSIVPIRKEPSHKSEMVSQLLFGELLTINLIDNDWSQITTCFDSYDGWVPNSSYLIINDDEYVNFKKSQLNLCNQPIVYLHNIVENIKFPIPFGCTLHGNSINIASQMKEIKLCNLDESFQSGDELDIIEIAKTYLNAPYLWGGRSIFGIDCSGFVQMVYKFKGIALKRDANLQVNQGYEVTFLTEVKPGDLAFFDNEEGKIIHVGILIDSSHIIHASGFVRIDSIDHNGIFNKISNKYTHKLRIIKRIMQV